MRSLTSGNFAAACACSAVITPASAIAFSTSLPRASAAPGLTRGLKRDGARAGRPGPPIGRGQAAADTPKYSLAAASMPQAPEPNRPG